MKKILVFLEYLSNSLKLHFRDLSNHMNHNLYSRLYDSFIFDLDIFFHNDINDALK